MHKQKKWTSSSLLQIEGGLQLFDRHLEPTLPVKSFPVEPSLPVNQLYQWNPSQWTHLYQWTNFTSEILPSGTTFTSEPPLPVKSFLCTTWGICPLPSFAGLTTWLHYNQLKEKGLQHDVESTVGIVSMRVSISSRTFMPDMSSTIIMWEWTMNRKTGRKRKPRTHCQA